MVSSFLWLPLLSSSYFISMDFIPIPLLFPHLWNTSLSFHFSGSLHIYYLVKFPNSSQPQKCGSFSEPPALQICKLNICIYICTCNLCIVLTSNYDKRGSEGFTCLHPQCLTQSPDTFVERINTLDKHFSGISFSSKTLIQSLQWCERSLFSPTLPLSSICTNHPFPGGKVLCQNPRNSTLVQTKFLSQSEHLCSSQGRGVSHTESSLL